MAGTDIPLNEEAVKSATAYATALARAGKAEEALAKAKRSTAEQTAFLVEQLRKQRTALDELEASEGTETAAYQQAREALLKTEKELYLQRRANADAINDAHESAQIAQQRFIELTETAVDKTRRLTNEIIALERENENLSPDEIQFQQNLEQIYALKGELIGLADEGEVAAGLLERAMDRASEGMTDAFFEFINGGENAFRNFISNILTEIARLSFEQAVSQPLTSALSASLGGLFGGETAAVVSHHGGLALPGAGRTVSSAAFIGAPRFHSGGLAGNEIPAILQRGEEVLTKADPRHRHNQAAAAPVTVHFKVTAIDAASFNTHLIQNRQTITAIINDAVNKRGRRGPSQ